MNQDIHDLLTLAAWSPSSHNTQPWQVRVKNTTATIGFNPARQLLVGDPDKKELIISLGCFVETFVLAAQEKGYKATVSIIDKRPDMVATVKLTPQKTPTDTLAWHQLIKKRRSNRRLYEAKPLGADALHTLRAINYGQASIQIFTDPEEIAFLATMTHDATFTVMSNPAFRAELASWVRNNWTRKPDGMPAHTQGMPGPVSLIAKPVIKRVKKVAGDQAKTDAKRILQSAAVGLVCIDSDATTSWLNAGRVYQRACLEALHYDIKTAGASAAVVLPNTRERITKRFKLGDKSPVALMRFGYYNGELKPTPRRPLNDFATF